MTTKSDKLVDVIVKNKFTHIIELSDHISNNSKEIGINMGLNNIVRRDIY